MRIEIAPGLRLFVQVEGLKHAPDGERPTLLLLHGGPGFDHSSFLPFFSRLRDVAQIVYVDHRGHGRSDACPSEHWRLDVWADDVVRLCTALGIERPVVLGQSFGGFVAQRYLARHPGHARAVILSSTSHHSGIDRKVAAFSRRGGPEAGAAARAFWEQPDARTFAAYWARCKAHYNTTPQAGRDATLQRLEILYHFAAGEKKQMDLRPGLGEVRCPVWVIAGEEDPVTPVDDAAEIAAALPAPWRHFVRVSGAGHGVWRDRPRKAERLLREILSQV